MRRAADTEMFSRLVTFSVYTTAGDWLAIIRPQHRSTS